MDPLLAAVGERIRSRMPYGMTQRELAQRVHMTPDALSRALNSQRGFSLTELARIAEALGADAHWILTGRADPHRMDFAARHSWDPSSRKRANPGQDVDQSILNRITELYRAAYPDMVPASDPLPDNPGAVRRLLGAEFVRRFAEVAEARLGIDVVRVSELTTDYSLTVGERGVILLRAMPGWFRSNWSLAHELGHLALGHHDGYASTTKFQEGAANAFAAELLLPADLVSGQDWTRIDGDGLVRFLWETGVSTRALQNRLSHLGLETSDAVREALTLSTPRLIRTHSSVIGTTDLDGPTRVADREQRASARRFPLHLVSALTQRVETGVISPTTLAWVLDVPLDDIDFPEPDDDQDAAATRYETAMAEPNAADIASWLGAQSA